MFLPRKVLTHKKLQHGAKLLFYEVMSLSQLRLGCIAENYYFMTIFNVKSERTIQNWLKQLKDNNLIEVEMLTRPNRRGQTRIIHPTKDIMQDMKTVKNNVKLTMNQYDNHDTDPDWFDEYMKNILKN